MDYRQVCNDVIELAKEVGKFIKENKKKIKEESVKAKGKHDFVTYVDKTSEEMLVSGLSEILPESAFIVEENTVEKEDKDYTWIVDPLDGTTNYIHGIPCYSVSIALYEKNKAVIGLVYEIESDECFYAYKGGKAYLNSEEIHVSKAKTINDSLIATGFPYYDYSKIKPFMSSLEHFMQNSHGVRRLGSAAIDLAYVACGRFEAFYEYSLSPWDVAAGAFIVQMAGGKVCDFSKEDNYVFGKEIIAANADVFEDFSNDIKSIFKE